ncbi:tetratricopeptide repeat protein [Salinibacter sp.]|uniref:tetratricopeptide repeat protein n=1 Tax=Salinibacter sp. TaxID=2065818 RepID=UPI0021E975E3|nr:tetratricopeptide repeat protein [Salinibacter sp.]
MKLTIQHVPESEPPQFRLRREQDGKTTDPVEIPSPYHREVGEGDRSLMDELRWYLENFLEYPFDPWTDRADRTLDELEAWGTRAFDVLFGGGDGRVWLDRARRDGDVQIAVSADDPHVLSWPWEGLYDPRQGWVVHQHAVTRCLNDVADPPPLPDLPDDRVNVLLVTARPLDEDAPFRSIARPLVETVKEQNLPASVTVLRPPTFDNLREHLREHPGRYHVVHFDGHGGYLGDSDGVPGGPYQMRGPQGHLVFETAGDSDPDPIPANRLSQLLREHNIPATVLNACQSGMVDDAADDAFASVAASLLRAGVRSVVAMSHAVMVSGAQEFIPSFYRRLFESGSLAEAVRAGRREMLAHPERISPRGRFPLQDWLVPVIYEQVEMPFDFVADADPQTDDAPDLPEPPAEVQGPYGFVGRDRELLQLERAMQRDPAGILFHGLGGVGKTTLVWGFLKWLADTGGLPYEPFWFTFSEIQSAEYVLNRVGERFCGEEFATLDTDGKLSQLVDTLDEHPHVLVWDNFESAAVMDEETDEALLIEEDQKTLRTLLQRLRGTGTKILITSRNQEKWLGGSTYVQRHVLGGLQGEERWRFCEEIVADLPGAMLDREDDALKELMETLHGHPLAMRVVLPRLADRSPEQLEETVRNNLDTLDATDDEVRERLYATLGLATDVLDSELHELLIPLRLHEHFVDANMLEEMAKKAKSELTREQIDRGLRTLSDIGLLQPIKDSLLYSIHPALTGYLRAQETGPAPVEQEKKWSKAFVSVMASCAAEFGHEPLDRKNLFVMCHETNIANAKILADQAGWMSAKPALTLFLALSANSRRLFGDAKRRYEELLEIWKQLEEVRAKASVCHELGVIAQKRRAFEEAEKWYRKAAEIKESLDDEHGTAITYHQLGMLALERRNLEEADKWCRKAAEIKERFDDEGGAATTYHQLGRVAQERRDFEEAEKWYRKAVKIRERLDDEHGAASTYHQLGMVALERHDLEEAEKWYRRAAEIFEHLDDEYRAASTYHQLGRVAQERHDLEEAEKWYRKSAEIRERLEDKHGLAQTYAQRGRLARERGDLRDAGNWFLKAIQGLVSTKDTSNAQTAIDNFISMFGEASSDTQDDLRQQWIDAGLSEEQLDNLLKQIE